MDEIKWSDQLSEELDQQVKAFISVRDYRFYQIEKLKKIAQHLEQHGSCLDCKHARLELENIVSNLDRMINKSGVNKSEYEKRVEKLYHHLKEKHQVYQAYHFTYTYSAIYTAVGVVFGLLLSYGVYFSFHPALFFFCAGTGTIIGNVLGARKDKDCRRERRQI